MEQMYMIEIFIDKVTIFASNDDKGTSNKNLIIKVKFGPKVEFIIKEGQMAVNEKKKGDKGDVIVTDEKTGQKKWTRTVRVGKSYLFPSFPDTILMLLSKFPLEIEVWNDDDTEQDNQIFVGVGNVHWDTNFFHMLKETSNSCKIHEPLAIKTKGTLMAECCCAQVGEIDLILRLSALGGSIITEFQQLLKDPESFVFRTNKAPSMFQCKRVNGDDPNFCMVGSLYETTTLEDPDKANKGQKKIEVCTELQSCGMDGKEKYACDHSAIDEEPAKKKYAIDKIKMGDIVGPCGNTNCALAHKVRKYIRALDSYKGKAAGIKGTKPESEGNVCGKCICKDDRWHRDECPHDTSPKVKCSGCEGLSKPGNTCEEKKDKYFGTGMTPKTSDTTVGYAFSVTKFPGYKPGMFGHDTIVEHCFCTKLTQKHQSQIQISAGGCSCIKAPTSKSSNAINNPMIYNLETNNPKSYNKDFFNQVSNSIGTNNPMTYNVATTMGSQTENKRKIQVYNFTETNEEKDCSCSPKKPTPPCKTFDCDCLSDIQNIASRKAHQPYCPSYKHKPDCPVIMNVVEEKKKSDEDEEEVASLPYGLPPIKLGPCPILGRPCTVPDGFARMYKNAHLPVQPLSYSDAGKICCSKEYERIKKAINEYMRNDNKNDFRCINKFNVDTERRCCDKEQVLMSLVGKSCCGSHKMAIREKLKEEKK